MKYLFSFIFSLFFISSSFSQDFISKKNGENIKVKVIEISTTEIKYKKYDNLDGPVYSILKSDVSMIRYENGTKDVFDESYPSEKPSGQTRIVNIPAGVPNEIENKKGYASLSIGPSIPMGEFGSTDFQNDKSGLAATGFEVDFNLVYTLSKSFGIISLIRWQKQPLAIAELETELSRQVPGVNFTITSNGWRSGEFKFGVFNAVPVNNRNTAFFEIKALLGVLLVSSPAYRITSQSGSSSGWIEMGSASANTFSISFVGGFRFNLNPHTALMVKMDYSNARPQFNNVVITYSSGGSDSFNFFQKMEIVNLGFGVAFLIK